MSGLRNEFTASLGNVVRPSFPKENERKAGDSSMQVIHGSIQLLEGERGGRGGREGRREGERDRETE